jgi:DNA-binding SARP family transcriptional activator
LADSPRLTVFMLRPFQVLVDGAPIDRWASQKSKTILKALLLRRGRAIANEDLIDLVWPDRGASQNNLDVAICHLRKALPFVERHDRTCRLSKTTTVWSDVDAFEQGVERAMQLDRDRHAYEAMKQYAASCQLYQNELLAEDGRDGWIVPIRQRLRDRHLIALDRLADYYLQTRDAVACSGTCAKILAVDTCNEAAHRYLMQCYAMLGQPNLVQLQYRRCVSTLRAQLGVAPQAETTELYRQLARCA